MAHLEAWGIQFNLGCRSWYPLNVFLIHLPKLIAFGRKCRPGEFSVSSIYKIITRRTVGNSVYFFIGELQGKDIIVASIGCREIDDIIIDGRKSRNII